jgi:hypothetical protein
MNITFSDKASAQTRVDKIHTDLIATNPLYAESAALYISSGGKVGTARWDFPKQELSKDTLWHVTVDSRAQPVLTKVESDTIPEWKVTEEVTVL